MKKFLKAFPIKAVIILAILYLVILIGVAIVKVTTDTLYNISTGFSSGKVLDEFKMYVAKFEGSNKLQVASIKSVDKFSKKDSQSILWKLISLPDVIIEIQTPVEYTYYLDLKGKWEFNWNDNDSSITITAPAIECGTPAVDISNLEIIEKKSSILRDNEKVKEKLKSELTEKLAKIAESKIILIKEIARTEAKSFLTAWFVNSYFKENKFNPKKIDLYFADEISNKNRINISPEF